LIWLKYVGALGFSTVENIGYSLQAGVGTGSDAALQVLLTAIQRIILSTPLHMTCAYLIGCGVVKRDVCASATLLSRTTRRHILCILQ
jgi:RsiW-degrading membrane proteinase PrsW (M82 family)